MNDTPLARQQLYEISIAFLEITEDFILQSFGEGKAHKQCQEFKKQLEDAYQTNDLIKLREISQKIKDFAKSIIPRF